METLKICTGTTPRPSCRTFLATPSVATVWLPFNCVSFNRVTRLILHSVMDLIWCIYIIGRDGAKPRHFWRDEHQNWDADPNLCFRNQARWAWVLTKLTWSPLAVGKDQVVMKSDGAIPWFRRFLSGGYHWNEPCPWQFYIEQSCEHIYHVPAGHGTNVWHVKIKIFLQFLASFQDMIQLDTNCYFVSWNVLSASLCGDSSTMTWSGLKSRYSQTKNIVISTLQSLEYIISHDIPSISPFTNDVQFLFGWISSWPKQSIVGFLEDSWMLIQTVGATIAWWAMWCWWTQMRMEIPPWWGWRPCLGDVPVMFQGLAQTWLCWLWKIKCRMIP